MKTFIEWLAIKLSLLGLYKVQYLEKFDNFKVSSIGAYQVKMGKDLCRCKHFFKMDARKASLKLMYRREHEIKVMDSVLDSLDNY